MKQLCYYTHLQFSAFPTQRSVYS